MTLLRGTILFEFSGPPSAGFSESWSWDGPVTSAPNRLNEIIAARATTLSSDWRIIGGRVGVVTAVSSGDPAKCRPKVSQIQALVCPTAIVGTRGPADTPWAALLVQLAKLPSALQSQTFAGAGKSRMQQHRGIPDGWWVDGALAIPDGDKVLLDNFYAQVTGDTWKLGQIKVTGTSSCTINFYRYRGSCLKRISNRRVGRTFFQLRGRRSEA